ncbi:MAG: hypothetical protein RIQ56_155 [Candidatus Parcubacteria bacterium]|jgi:hypothetical protein
MPEDEIEQAQATLHVTGKLQSDPRHVLVLHEQGQLVGLVGEEAVGKHLASGNHAELSRLAIEALKKGFPQVE